MTMSTITNRVAYAGDGVSTAFAVPFPFGATTDLEVWERTLATGAEVLKTLTTHYTVTGGAGLVGTVTATSPPSALVQWIILRATPQTQLTDFEEGDPFPAANIEANLDKLMRAVQDVNEKTWRAPTLSKGTPVTTPLVLPPPGAGQMLKWNAAGTALETGAVIANPVTGLDTLSNYASFAALVAAAGASERTVIVDVAGAVAANTTTPETLHLWFLRSGALTVSGGVTLTVNGYVTSGAYQIFAGAGAVVFGDKAKDNLNAAWFAPDPWDGFDGAAASACAGTGGTITLPVAIYDADKQVVISSEYRVNLKSDMGSMSFAAGAVVSGGYIRPRAGIGAAESLIEYKSPHAARYRHGAGTVSGLAFLDDSNLGDADIEARRTIPIQAALRLTDFDFGVVRDCRFMYIKGSAIQTDRAVQSSIIMPMVMHCGDTGFPAVNIGGDALTTTQSFTIIDPRIEHNFNAPYLEISSVCTDVKVIGGQFEALTGKDTADKSCQTFIKTAGPRTIITGCGLNKNAALKVEGTSAATGSKLTDCIFSGQNVSGAFTWACGNGGVSNVAVSGAATIIESDAGLDLQAPGNTTTQITLSGDRVSVANLTVVNGGKTLVSGRDATLVNLNVYYPFWAVDEAGAVAAPVLTEDCAVEITGRRCKLVGGSIVGCGDAETPLVGVAGVKMAEVYGAVIGTAFRKLDKGVVFTVNGSKLVDGAAFDAVTTPFTDHDTFASINIRNCVGFKTEGAGSASIGAAATEVVVTHGLAVTPTDVQVSFASDPGSAAKVWAHTIGATTFKVTVDAAPGGSGVSVKWRAARTVN